MSPSSLFTALLATLSLRRAAPAHDEAALQKRAVNVIPDTCFDSIDDLQTYFAYGYPWGDIHNTIDHVGAALMAKTQVGIVGEPGAAYLQLQSDYTGSSDANSTLKYNSGAISTNDMFTVAPGGGFDFQANFVAPLNEGSWPGFWLSGESAPLVIDLAEWRGNSGGMVSFESLGMSGVGQVDAVAWPEPLTAWHTVKVELRAQPDETTVSVAYYLNGELVATHSAADVVGQPMWLILDYQMLGESGETGPTDTTYFIAQSLSVTSYNP